MFTGH